MAKRGQRANKKGKAEAEKRVEDKIQAVMNKIGLGGEKEGLDAPSFFSTELKGRYGRLNFMNGFFIYLLFERIINNFFPRMLLVLTKNSEMLEMLELIITVPLSIANAIFLYRIVAIRAQDFNMRWWKSALIYFGLVLLIILGLVGVEMSSENEVTSISLIALGLLGGGLALAFAGIIVLMAIPGTKGVNDFGAPSKRGTQLGLYYMIFAVFFIVSVVVYKSF